MGKPAVKYFLVDAFTDSAFKGNPGVVCFLHDAKDENWLQAVAAEFNVPTTGFLTPVAESVHSPIPRFQLRWFTPVSEVKLCGHVTLAASHALFTNSLVNSDLIEFETHSDILTAKKLADTVNSGAEKDRFYIELNFPVVPLRELNSVDIALVSRALNGATIIDIERTTGADDLFVVLESGKDVAELKPRFDEVVKCPGRGIIVSGVAPPESGFDFYSRFFCPKFGVNEDPVCGSAHCALAPYWSKKLNGKLEFIAFAASGRSGKLNIRLDKENKRVLLRGEAVNVMEGYLLV